jgi:hypothetical protein
MAAPSPRAGLGRRVTAGRSMLSVLRLVCALLTAVALGWQLSIHIEMGFSVANFFSYFTNLSNLFAAAVLFFGALSAGRGASNLYDQLRAVSVVNMTVVGLVFAVLLRNADLGALLPWVNIVLHYVMPSVIILEWLLAPPAMKFGTRQLLLVLVFPTLYLIYTLIRGRVLGWYPYPFLNPASVGGYGVAVHAVGIAVTFIFAGWILLAAANRLGVAAVAARNAGVS